MNRNAILVVWLLIVLSGCADRKADDRLSFLREEGIDRVRVVTTMKPASRVCSSSHPELVGGLIDAIVGASPDTAAYDTAKATRLDLFKGGELRHTLRTGGSLFNFRGAQYHDKTGAFGRIVATICSGLGSAASVPRTHYRMGSQIDIKWTVKNYSDKLVTIPGRMDGAIEWAVPAGTHSGAWVGGSRMALRVSTGEEGAVDLCTGSA